MVSSYKCPKVQACELLTITAGGMVCCRLRRGVNGFCFSVQTSRRCLVTIKFSKWGSKNHWSSCVGGSPIDFVLVAGIVKVPKV